MENDTQWLEDEIQCPEANPEGYKLNQSFEFWMEGVAQTILAILGRSKKIVKLCLQITENCIDNFNYSKISFCPP